jgi:hypothetical protein
MILLLLLLLLLVLVLSALGIRSGIAAALDKPKPPAPSIQPISLSVIIPLPDQRTIMPHIQTISNILDRKLSDKWEIVLLHSKDIARNVAHMGHGKNVAFCKVPSNAGIRGAVNRGLRMARGKYILLVPGNYTVKEQEIEALETQMCDIEARELGLVLPPSAKKIQSTIPNSIAMISSKLNSIAHLSKYCDLDSPLRLLTRKTARLLTLPSVAAFMPFGSLYYRAMVYYLKLAHEQVPVDSAPLVIRPSSPIKEEVSSWFGVLDMLARVLLVSSPNVRQFLFNAISIGLDVERRPAIA